jgi:outer membrane lipoprotein-sorting protein
MADVVKAAAKHNIVKYSLVETSESGDRKGTASTVCYADLKSARSRWERETIVSLNGAVEASSFQVWDFEKNRHLFVTSETATKAANDPNLDERLKQALRELNLPRNNALITTIAENPKKTLLESLRELEKHRDATSASDKVGRRDAIKYIVEDGNKTTTLWVDTKTKLPLRMEFEIIDASPECQRLHMLFSDFEWDPALKAHVTLDELFSTVPPAGFRVTDRTQDAK